MLEGLPVAVLWGQSGFGPNDFCTPCKTKSFMGINVNFYRPRMWRGNLFSHVCLCVLLSECLSVDIALTFASFELARSFSVYR